MTTFTSELQEDKALFFCS